MFHVNTRGVVGGTPSPSSQATRSEISKRLFGTPSNNVAEALLCKKDHGRAEALLSAAHGHWAEGGNDYFTSRVWLNITMAELRRAADAPPIID